METPNTKPKLTLEDEALLPVTSKDTKPKSENWVFCSATVGSFDTESEFV